MASDNVLIVSDFRKPSIPGAHYSLRCMTGPKKGEIYYLRGDRVIIGRNENVDISLHDESCSRKHAEIKRFGSQFIITDLGSNNGTYVNGVKISQKNLEDGDQIACGKVVFKYKRVEVNDDEINVFNEKKNNDVKKDKKKPMMFFIMVLVAFYLLMDDEKEVDPRKTVDIIRKRENSVMTQRAIRDLNREKDETEQKLESIFNRGQRELREKNYFRALEEFNMALIISPKNGEALYYVRRTQGELDKEIDKISKTAALDLAALRIKSAITSYCSIIRILRNSPEDKRYINVTQKLEDIKLKFKLKENEIKCF